MACPLSLRIAASLVLCAFAGCSTTATITRPDGLACDANILGSDATSLRIRDSYGRDFVVSREEVAEIDHPGNVIAVIGLGLIAMSAPLIIGDLSHRGDANQSEWSGMGLVVGIPMAVTGLSLAIPGLVHYRRSTRQAKAFEDANPILPVPRPPIFVPYPYPAPYPYPPSQPRP